MCLALLVICSAKSLATVQPELLGAGIFSSGTDPDDVYRVFEQIEGTTDLPHGSAEAELIPTAIRVMLGVFSVLLTGVAIYSGILFVGQFGYEERVEQARKLIIWAVVGAVVTALSYAIISGVLNLEFD